jgi:hypothetical protein
MYLVASACAFMQPKVIDEVLVESPRGAVFLQKAEDRWFGTAHPISLSPSIVATVLRGARVQALSTDRETGTQVFSEEDTEFLTPLMSTALSKAVKSQVVGFRVSHDSERGKETTSGILYVQGRLLHLTLNHYRAKHEQSGLDDTSGRLIPNPTGLDQRQIAFTPEAARRTSRHEQLDIINSPPLASFVIDYEALSAHLRHQDQAPVIQPQGHATLPHGVSDDLPAVHTKEIDAVQTPVKGKATDIEALKEEVRMLQRRLTELDAELQRTKNQ